MVSVKISRQLLLIAALQLFCVLFLSQSGSCQPHKNLFPLFPVIKDNVIFWEKIYGVYSVNTAVVHDRDNLAIIYETIPLLDRNLPGVARVNHAHIQRVKKKYASILHNLALGKTPATPLEKRIFNLFPANKRLQRFKIASENIRVQTGLKEQFSDGVIRSKDYIAKMKEIFRSYKLPEDLAYLPHVESSFNTAAHSKAGAAGVWQFTRSTGATLLTIDDVIDERRDPLQATHAAAKYLKRSFNRLGTWPLSITSYNYGHAGMVRAVQAEGTYEKIFTDYAQGHFKFASKNFYAEFLAARNVAKQQEVATAFAKATPRKTLSLKLNGYADIADVSRHFGVTSATLQELNPSLLSSVWSREKFIPKGFLLQLPHQQKTIDLAKNVPQSLLHTHQKKAQVYRVKSGDTAGKIAQKHGISLQRLSKVNQLGKGAVVYAGQTLRIPHGLDRSPVKSKTAALSTKPVRPEGIPLLRSAKKKNTGIMPPPKAAAVTTWQELEPSAPVRQDGKAHGTATVLAGETLGLYVEWLKITEKTFLAANKFPTRGAISPGRTVVLPFVNTTRHEFDKQRLWYHRHNEETFFNAFKVSGFKRYTVAQGDTLWNICRKKFDLPIWLLKKYNTHLRSDMLSANQHLDIPIIESL